MGPAGLFQNHCAIQPPLQQIPTFIAQTNNARIHAGLQTICSNLTHGVPHLSTQKFQIYFPLRKSAFQAQDKEQIVARFMIEELAFRGIASEAECTAVMGAYDKGEFPASSGWNYARFFVPRAYAGGLRMAESAPKLWRAFEDAHLQAQLDGPPEIPMKYFTAAIEAALLTCVERDSETLSLDAAFWTAMVDRSRYVMARRAGRTMLSAITVR